MDTPTCFALSLLQGIKFLSMWGLKVWTEVDLRHSSEEKNGMFSEAPERLNGPRADILLLTSVSSIDLKLGY